MLCQTKGAFTWRDTQVVMRTTCERGHEIRLIRSVTGITAVIHKNEIVLRNTTAPHCFVSRSVSIFFLDQCVSQPLASKVARMILDNMKNVNKSTVDCIKRLNSLLSQISREKRECIQILNYILYIYIYNTIGGSPIVMKFA